MEKARDRSARAFLCLDDGAWLLAEIISPEASEFTKTTVESTNGSPSWNFSP
jgi:hypothetical protein